MSDEELIEMGAWPVDYDEMDPDIWEYDEEYDEDPDSLFALRFMKGYGGEQK